MNFLKYIFLIFLLFSFKINASEISKVRYIDIDFIFKNSIVGKQINEIAIKDREKKLKQIKRLKKN